MRLKTEPKADISVFDLVDGDIAIITKFSSDVDNYNGLIGTIVQRFDDFLVVLGKPSSASWVESFLGSMDSAKRYREVCRCKILPPGTEFVV